MGSRPNWRVIVFWMRRPCYVAAIFTVVILGTLFLDGNLNLWNGLIVRNSGIANLLVGIAWAVLILPAFFWNVLKWGTTLHFMTEEQFVFSKGILNKKKFVVNYENIQNINVDRSLSELILMLSTLRIETAGSKPGESEIEVEGIASGETEKMVREITHMVEGTKGKGTSVPATGRAAPAADSRIEKLEEDMKAVTAELKEIKNLLAAEKRKKDLGARKD